MAIDINELKSYKSKTKEELIKEIAILRQQLFLKENFDSYFSTFFTFSPITMAVLSYPEYKFIAINKTFSAVTGYRATDMIGKTSSDMNLYLNSTMQKSIRTILDKEKVLYNFECILNSKNGTKKNMLFSAEVHVDKEKAFVILWAVDIGSSREKESILQEELNRLNRFHIAGEIAASIGHEVRNPLTTIRGFLQLLSKKESCLKYEPYFHLMIEELDRANTIIGEFLSLTKSTTLILSPQQLNGIIEAIHPLLVADATLQNKMISLQLASKLPEVFLNEGEIRQLIFNLVRNGLEAMSASGRIFIRTYLHEQEVILSIADTGCGMTTEQINKIWDPFVSTKKSGTGLGLTICRNIVQRHNAKITVSSSPNGTTFFVHFPIP